LCTLYIYRERERERESRIINNYVNKAVLRSVHTVQCAHGAVCTRCSVHTVQCDNQKYSNAANSNNVRILL